MDTVEMKHSHDDIKTTVIHCQNHGIKNRSVLLHMNLF
jgi:hypothetical protein